jgi:hypothetical protein
MAVQPNYFISGIWKSREDKDKITHFFIHKNMEGGFKKGEIKSAKDVIKLLEAKSTMLTLTWSYESTKWIDGVEVKLVELNGEKLIRSFKDHQQTDHLVKLINMAPIMAAQTNFLF